MTDDETPIGTAEAARLLGICTRKARALIRSKKLDGWAIETPGGHVHAWRTTRAAVEAYKRGGRRELAVARAGKPSWLVAELFRADRAVEVIDRFGLHDPQHPDRDRD